MGPHFLIEWQNLPYTISLGVAFILLLISILFGFEHEMGGGHVDAHVHIDVDAHGVYHDVDHGHEVGHETGSLGKILALFGIGRVPISILFMLILFLFGGIGLALNMLLGSMISQNIYLLSLIVTLVMTLFVTGRLATVIAKYMPSVETITTSSQDVIGKTGISVYGVDPQQGFVNVYDQYGNLRRIAAKTAIGVIAANKQVVVEEYVKNGDYYVVSEVNL